MNTIEGARFTYIGGPTAVIEFGGVRFLTDPTFDPPGDYTSGPVTLSKTAGPALPSNRLGTIDAVLLSHDHHSDNLDHSGRKMLPSASLVITTVDGAARLGGNAIGLAAGEQHTVSSQEGQTVAVTAVPARHGPEGHDRGPVIGFVLEREDKSRAVYVSGDTVWFEPLIETLRHFPNIETAVLFMGAARVAVAPGPLTLTAEEGVRLAQALPRAAIVPLHYEGWKHFSENRKDITEAFRNAGLEARLHWLPPGEPA